MATEQRLVVGIDRISRPPSSDGGTQPDPIHPAMQELYDEVGIVPAYKGEDYRIRYD